jgi:dTDP-glucose 4,6-dehydratase
MTVLVTGGLGFIGSNFVIRHLEKYPDERVVVVDNESYAASRTNLSCVADKVIVHKVDIADKDRMNKVMAKYMPHIIYNFAAESHVDNSIADDSVFYQTNVMGTLNLLHLVKEYQIKLLHVSTDEVYGSLSLDTTDVFTEKTPYNPLNPYSASKAASDHMVRAYVNTHKIKAVVTNCSNNYGPRQHSEKLIPTIIRRAKANMTIPIYGNGSNVRDWLYVDDHCDALLRINEAFVYGERYNIGGHNELTNLSLARYILDLMGKPRSLIEFVKDRPGHDARYAISTKKIEKELKWRPTTTLEVGMKKTLEYYNA